MGITARHPLLLVEGDPALAGRCRDVLTRQGWECLLTATAEEALHLMESAGPPLSLIVLDQTQAQGTGWQLLAAARRRRPPVPVLSIVEVEGDDAQARTCLERGAVDCLARNGHFWHLLPASIERALRIDAAATNASRLSAIIESSPDPIFSIGLTGTILTWNPAAARLYGADADTMVGSVLLDHIPAEERDQIERAWIRAARGHPQRLESRRICVDGGIVPVSCAMSAIEDAGHRPRSIVVVEQDLRPRQDVLRLQDRSRELSRINAELDQFATVAAHDLQAPLRVACLQLDLLAQQATRHLSDDDRRLLEDTQATLRRSAAMIGRILDYSRDASVDLAADRPVDADAACHEALANLRAQIAESRAEIRVDPLPIVRCEQSHLVRVFQNLIGNAIKHRHPNRAPRIRIDSALDGDHSAAVTISDNGIGVVPEDVDTLFTPFSRRSSTSQGNGIGLAVCRKLIEARGGILSLARSSPQGSVFRFTLPLAGEGDGTAASSRAGHHVQG